MDRRLIDLSTIDLTRSVVSEQEIRKVIPHRDKFQMIDGICHVDLETGVVVAWKDWDEDPWWGAGHLPGRPLMPGVLMIEGAAQACSYLIHRQSGWPEGRFVGMGGVDKVRFRNQVVPPARVYFVGGNGVISGTRLARYRAEAWCRGLPVMEMELLGVLL
jgi:3-hydroxyacyl-[acyl-carrier-protein] dehydratase